MISIRLRLPILALITLVVSATRTEQPLDAAVPSDQVGVYAWIQKVEFTPDAATARSVKIHGAFAVAQGRNGNYYRSPIWGVLAFHVDAEQADKCRKQWSDLAAVAGTGQIIGFGFRYRQENVRVLAAGAKLKTTTFHTGMGIRKVRNANYGPVMQLRHFPRPISPLLGAKVTAAGGRRPEQSIEFTCETCIASDESIRYLFEFEQKNGDIRGSQPLAARDGRTNWSTTIVLTPGEEVKWRVRVIAKDLTSAPVATGSFVPVEEKR